MEPIATSLFVSLLPSVIYNGFGTGAAQVNPLSIPFLFGGQMPLNIYLMQPVNNPPPSTFPYNIINIVGTQLFCYLTTGQVGGTIYTQQLDWTIEDADTNSPYFSANLPMNTANLQTLLGTGTQAFAYLQLAFIQNGQPVPISTFRVSIGVGVPIVNLQVPAGLTPLSAEVARATYQPLQPVAGQGIALMSALGKRATLFLQDNPDGTATPVWNKQN